MMWQDRAKAVPGQTLKFLRWLCCQGIVKHADGSTTLKFAPTVDEICTDIRLLVVHLVSADVSFKKPKKGFMPPGLALLLEVLPLIFAIVMIL